MTPDMQIAYPLRIDDQGLLASVSDEDHITQMIEQVIFTVPGERVNRPDFGCGLAGYVFSSPNTEVVAALQGIVQGSLQRWLGDMIQTEFVLVQMEDSTMTVTVRYLFLQTGQLQTIQLTR